MKQNCTEANTRSVTAFIANAVCNLYCTRPASSQSSGCTGETAAVLPRLYLSKSPRGPLSIDFTSSLPVSTQQRSLQKIGRKRLREQWKNCAATQFNYLPTVISFPSLSLSHRPINKGHIYRAQEKRHQQQLAKRHRSKENQAFH